MIKAILFDFWGTLVEQGLHSPLKELHQIFCPRTPFSEFVIKAEKAMMISVYPSFKEMFLSLENEFNYPLSEEFRDNLIGFWNKNWMLAHPYPETEAILKELKESHALALISNTDCISIERVMEKFSLKQIFDKIFLSYKLGLIKSEPEFLKTALEELKLEKEDVLVVGDSLQSDIYPAKKMGIKAILVDRKNKRDYELKITSLNELPELIKRLNKNAAELKGN
ncbi:HAD family hydrolase [Candidatus Woesearchaeota archaeon]|nr:HAD family hydrolase [Candidatus Woesearchaeota archaeon]